MLYTSCYDGSIKGTAISINLTPPPDFTGEQLAFFAPTRSIISAWRKSPQDQKSWDAYKQQFIKDILNRRWLEIKPWLESLQPDVDITLLAYREKPEHEKYSHRHIVGDMIHTYRGFCWGGDISDFDFSLLEESSGEDLELDAISKNTGVNEQQVGKDSVKSNSSTTAVLEKKVLDDERSRPADIEDASVIPRADNTAPADLQGLGRKTADVLQTELTLPKIGSYVYIGLDLAKVVGLEDFGDTKVQVIGEKAIGSYRLEEISLASNVNAENTLKDPGGHVPSKISDLSVGQEVWHRMPLNRGWEKGVITELNYAPENLLQFTFGCIGKSRFYGLHHIRVKAPGLSKNIVTPEIDITDYASLEVELVLEFLILLVSLVTTTNTLWSFITRIIILVLAQKKREHLDVDIPPTTKRSVLVVKEPSPEEVAMFGSRVTHKNIYHTRGGSTGVIEGINDLNGEIVVHWLEDGQTQSHISQRSFPLSELIFLQEVKKD